MQDVGRDLGLLTVRLTLGGYLAGHGAQKLFGVLGGHGLEETGGRFESLGLAPGEQHAALAGVAELGGGLLTAMGLGGPAGPIATMGPMIVAAGTAHRGKGPFGQAGGWELPATNLSIAGALALAGPGRLSVDRALGIRVPAWLGGAALAGVAAASAVMVARAVRASRAAAEARRADEERTVDVTGQPAEWRADRTLAEQAAPAR